MGTALAVLAGFAFDPAAVGVHAFVADLKRCDVRAAHARVRGWAKPTLADPGLFARYWEALVRCHGPLLGADQVQRDRQTVGGRLRFARQDYVFLAVPGTGGKLDQLQLVPYPVGGAMLVRASHGVRVAAADPKAPAAGTVTFAVPGRQLGQVPLSLRVAADPPEALTGCTLRKRADGLNWLLEATVNPGKAGATVFWEAAVLTRTERSDDYRYGGRPPAPTPAAPPEAARWLCPTAAVQSDDPGIVAVADKLWVKSPDVRDYAEAVAKWVSANEGTGKPFDALDAKTALGCGGSCTSRANLAAALFRARGIPARTVAHLPTWAGPLYVHWLTEYWHPGAGWRLAEPSRDSVYVNQAELVVLNVATPEDEDDVTAPNARSGVMAGAPRLSSRELNGPLRTIPFLGNDLRTWGLALPLADLNEGNGYPLLRPVDLTRWLYWLTRYDPELFVQIDRLVNRLTGLPDQLVRVARDTRRAALWAAAGRAHDRLTVNDPKGPKRVAAAQAGGVSALTAVLD